MDASQNLLLPSGGLLLTLLGIYFNEIGYEEAT